MKEDNDDLMVDIITDFFEEDNQKVNEYYEFLIDEFNKLKNGDYKSEFIEKIKKFRHIKQLLDFLI